MGIAKKIRLDYKSIEFILIAVMILSTIIVYSIPTSKRAEPMGPIIGGDLYAHVGAVRSIRENWKPWIDQLYDSGIGRAYSWLWHLFMAGLSLIIPLKTLLLWSPLVFWIISIIGIYFAGKMLYGKKFGLLLTMLYFLIGEESLISPNPKNLLIFSFFLTIALLYKAFETKKITHSVIAGIVMALTFMNYSMLIVLPAVPVFYVLINVLLKKYKGEHKKDLLADVKCAAIIVVLAIIISIPYWLPIVSSINPEKVQAQSISSSIDQHEGAPFFTRIYEITFNFFVKKWYFIPFFIAGLFFIFTKFDKKSTLLIALLITLYIGRFHDYLTKLLLGWRGVQPFYFPMFVNYAYWLIIALGCLALLNKASELISNKLKKQDFTLKHVKNMIIILLFIAVFIIGNTSTYKYLLIGPESWKNYVAASYQPLPRMFTEPANWVSKNTNDNDVIIAHPFYAYGIFGLTGRHIYASMYGHMLSLLDDNDRRADAQEIYTTNDVNRALELLQKRKATYLIVDPYSADKTQWFQVDHWDVIEGKKPMPQDERNITKFFDNPHFESVYNYTENINGQQVLVVSIFKIKY